MVTITIRRVFLLILFFFLIINLFAQRLEGTSSFPVFEKQIMAPVKLPKYYDLRKSSRIGKVKTQPNGGCWASAAIGSVESVRRTFGCGDEVLSDVNLKLFNGFVPDRSTNGNHYMATAYFTRRSGPLIKCPENDSVFQISPVTVQYITDARYLPNDPELVKKTIMQFGAVYTMMYHNKLNLDTVTNIYYTLKSKINHAVLLIGWNDTLYTKTGNGAWIAQNSLGPNYGDNGFFYIPYHDPNILEYNAIWPHWIPYEEGSQIYFYDTLGSFHSYGLKDTMCYGLVKFVAEKDIEITKIATHINSAGIKVHAEIYDHFNPSSGKLSGLITAINPDRCQFAGYYSFSLNEPVNIIKGEDFYVMIGYYHPTDTMPLPIERYIKGYAEPHITAKKCWINPDYKRWPTTWYECGTESTFPSLNFDLCIRVYCLEIKNKPN
jgi:hypothetical protein